MFMNLLLVNPIKVKRKKKKILNVATIVPRKSFAYVNIDVCVQTARLLRRRLKEHKQGRLGRFRRELFALLFIFCILFNVGTDLKRLKILDRRRCELINIHARTKSLQLCRLVIIFIR